MKGKVAVLILIIFTIVFLPLLGWIQYVIGEYDLERPTTVTNGLH